MFLFNFLKIIFNRFYLILANVTSWSLILHGTSTPPPIDLIDQNKDTQSTVPEKATEDFDHNSIDTDPPSLLWKTEAEV